MSRFTADPGRVRNLPGGARISVVGEFYRGDNLSVLAGRDLVWAYLIPEPTNTHDPNAIMVNIEGRHVGYLDRDTAARFATVAQDITKLGVKARAAARVVNGRDIVLNLGSPDGCLKALESRPAETEPRPFSLTLSGSAPLQPRAEFMGRTVCFTGQSIYGFDRSTQERFAAEAGMVVLPRITRALDILVLANPASQSGKARKARGYGVREMGESTFWEAIGVKIEDTGT